MAIVVEMPRLSDTMEEGTLVGWRKQVGEHVEPGEELADIETDKAVMAFESFDEGVLLKRLVDEGTTLPLDAPIAILGEEGEDVSELAQQKEKELQEAIARLEGGGGGAEAPSEPAAEEQPAATEEQPAAAAAQPADAAPEPAQAEAPAAAASEAAEEGPVAETAQPPQPGWEAPPAPTDERGVRVRATPVARRIAAERGLDLRTVEGTGPRGRILKRDVEDLEPVAQVKPAAAAKLSGPGGWPGAGGGVQAEKEDTVVRAGAMRKTIAKRLVEAKQTAPHYYLTITCDADPLSELRKELNDSQERVRLSVNDLLMRACLVTLPDHPMVNAAWEGTQIRQFGGIHLGFAVAIEQGLITPVIRNAEQLGLLDLAERTRTLAARAREQALEPEEYQGNSFCISNLGMYGIERFTAIINPPAACILAIGTIREEPVARDGELTVGRRITLTMSCDHRVVDGATGAAFLDDLKRTIEHPLRALL